MESINTFNKGLNTDVSPVEQPDGTYRFALNAINESSDGDEFIIGNELQNLNVQNLPQNFTIVGKCYMYDNKVCLILAHLNENRCQIGIYDTLTDVYITHVDDNTSIDSHKLNIRPWQQIEIIYRLRQGCNHTIYFVEKDTKPRFFDFNNPQKFQNSNGSWNQNLFNLQVHYESIPEFDDIEVLDSGGNIPAGKVNVAVQYLDADFNPTEFAVTSPLVNIYHDSINADYNQIDGSTSYTEQFLDFGNTNKSIKTTLSALDTNLPFYRLALIERNDISGKVSSVKYTDAISTLNNIFVYTGDNAPFIGTEEEVLFFTDLMSGVKNINQIDNQLILGNIKGSNINYCLLQKYASKITADCVTKEVNLTDNQHPLNPKNPHFEFNNGVGYMPGELYSFGIVYIFEDNTLSPVCHIPGKSPGHNPGTIFSSSGTIGTNVFPMSGNNSTSYLYTDNNNCGNTPFWGLDSAGLPLLNQNVRHHRFPKRSEINKSLVNISNTQEQVFEFQRVSLNLIGNLVVPVSCPPDTPDCGTDIVYTFQIKVTFTYDGQEHHLFLTINTSIYADGINNSVNINLTVLSDLFGSETLTIDSIEISDINGDFIDVNDTDSYLPYFTEEPTYDVQIDNVQQVSQGKIVTSDILGIRFNNIEVPNESEIGKKVVGYYIVRNEKEEADKSILDTGILLPTLKNNKYISTGLLNPITSTANQERFFKGLIHLDFLFKNKKHHSFEKLEHEGNFIARTTGENIARGLVCYNDVEVGSSYDSETQHSENDDADAPDTNPNSRGLDGWCLNIYNRTTHLEYESTQDFILDKSDDIENNFYLDSLESKSVKEEANDVYNLSSDNKLGIIQVNNTGLAKLPSLFDANNNNKYPYVLMTKINTTAYSNFRLRPYYKESKNPHYFIGNNPSSASIYNGDSYISPLTYVSTVFNANRVAFRRGKSNTWKYIVAGTMIAASIVGAIFSGGLTAAIGIPSAIALLAATTASGILFLSSGIKGSNMAKAYEEEWQKGLRNTATDTPISNLYGSSINENENDSFLNPMTPANHNIPHASSQDIYNGPSDDTIQWVGECLADLWFEANVNTHLRHRLKGDVPCYITAPLSFQQGNINSAYFWHTGSGNNSRIWRHQTSRYPVSKLERYLVQKLTTFDSTKNDGKAYLGLALGEYYAINEAYHAKNKQKAFYHLPIEYDCCSDCREQFPQRWRWSQQSFQEELSDNYRVFLPNNYKDLQDGTGEINNLVVLNNNLYIHTTEAFYQQPRNYQERVTDQIVSFIGTGSYGELPEVRLVSDGINISAGLQHKQAHLYTPQYYWFWNVKDSKVYRFSNNNGLEVVSQKGLNNFFLTNSKFEVEEEYLKSNNQPYPFKDNPSNPLGTGIIFGYDSKYERVIVTKKDFKPFYGERNAINIIFYEDDNTLFSLTQTEYNNLLNLLPTGFSWNFKEYLDGNLIFYNYHNNNPTNVTFNYWDGKDILEETIPVINILYQEISLSLEDYRKELKDFITNDKSFTLSFSLKANEARGTWISHHSYLPYIYFQVSEKLYSLQGRKFEINKETEELEIISNYSNIYLHNTSLNTGEQIYQQFYEKYFPFIIDYVAKKDSSKVFVLDHIKWEAFTRKYFNPEFEEFIETNYIAFNKAIIYNNRQCTGLLTLKVKDTDGVDENYLIEQTTNLDDGTVIIDKNETNWTLNDIRDYVINTQIPIWLKSVEDLQENYYIDKVLNENAIDFNKDWQQLEKFRDKFVAVRLIFDNFANSSNKMFFRFSENHKTISER